MCSKRITAFGIGFFLMLAGVLSFGANAQNKAVVQSEEREFAQKKALTQCQESPDQCEQDFEKLLTILKSMDKQLIEKNDANQALRRNLAQLNGKYEKIRRDYVELLKQYRKSELKVKKFTKESQPTNQEMRKQVVTLCKSLASSNYALEAAYKENTLTRKKFGKLEAYLTNINNDGVIAPKQIKENEKKTVVKNTQCSEDGALNQAAKNLLYSIIGDISQITPASLRDVQDFGENPQNYIFNNFLAGWMRGKNFGDLRPVKGRKAGFATTGIQTLQKDMNKWLNSHKITARTLHIPEHFDQCGRRLCEDGIVGRRTKIVAEYIYKKDPKFFPGAVPADELKKMLAKK